MRPQTKLEEQLNASTHGLGALLAIAGLVLLIVLRDPKTPMSLFAVLMYGISMIVLFSASTFYHSVTDTRRKHLFRVIDHISIYLLIAGTYTPVVLLMLQHSRGWGLFWAVWSIAAFGVILKLFFTGRFEIFSTLLYVVMGWLVVFDISALIDVMPNGGLWLMVAGGISYMLGIVFYSFERIPYNHVIWHVFVLGGAICHFLMVLLYVI